MALKTNSKQAKINLWNYLETFRDTINEERICWEAEHNYLQPGDRAALAEYIYNTFKAEKVNNNLNYRAGRINEQDLFTDWAQGLAMCGMFDYWATDARNLLGDILEETEAEREKFTEEQAEKLLTYLIYREVKNARRAKK